MNHQELSHETELYYGCIVLRCACALSRVIANAPVERRRETGEAAEYSAVRGIVSVQKTSQASLAKCDVMCTLGWANQNACWSAGALTWLLASEPSKRSNWDSAWSNSTIGQRAKQTKLWLDYRPARQLNEATETRHKVPQPLASEPTKRSHWDST